VTVVAYFAAAYLALRAFKFQKQTADVHRGVKAYVEAISSCLRAFQWFKRPLEQVPPKARAAMFWLILAVVFSILGINKQLDLQSALTEGARIITMHLGLYEGRWTLQLGFMALVAVCGIVAVTGIMKLARGHMVELRLALIGATFVVCFVIIRAVSFHHIDRLIDSDILDFRMNWILELGGIIIVGIGAGREAHLPWFSRPARSRDRAEPHESHHPTQNGR